MFSSKWRETVKAFLIRIENQVFEEPVAVKMALFLKSKNSEILKLVERAEKLAITIQKQPSVVFMSLEDYNSLTETAYLLQSPQNAARLNEAVADFTNGQNFKKVKI